jgi:hypothetical protein
MDSHEYFLNERGQYQYGHYFTTIVMPEKNHKI